MSRLSIKKVYCLIPLKCTFEKAKLTSSVVGEFIPTDTEANIRLEGVDLCPVVVDRPSGD